PAAELADLLHRRDVLGLLDDADHRRVAPGVETDPALLGLGDVAAGLAEPDPLCHLDERRRQPPDVLRVGGEQVKGDALRALRPNAGQPPELIDKALYDAFVHALPSAFFVVFFVVFFVFVFFVVVFFVVVFFVVVSLAGCPRAGATDAEAGEVESGYPAADRVELPLLKVSRGAGRVTHGREHEVGDRRRGLHRIRRVDHAR